MNDLAEAALTWVHLHKGQDDGYRKMTLRQMAVLGIVADDSPIDFGALSGKLGLSKPVATRAVFTLGQLGLVNQRLNQNDRRFRTVSITAAGKRYRQSLRLPASGS